MYGESDSMGYSDTKNKESKERLFSDKEWSRLLRKSGAAPEKAAKEDDKSSDELSAALLKSLDNLMNGMGMSKDEKRHVIGKNIGRIRERAELTADFFNGLAGEPVSELDALKAKRKDLLKELKEHAPTPEEKKNARKKVSTHLSWEEMYPASYLYTPSETMIRFGLEVEIGEVDKRIAALSPDTEKDAKMGAALRVMRNERRQR